MIVCSYTGVVRVVGGRGRPAKHGTLKRLFQYVFEVCQGTQSEEPLTNVALRKVFSCLLFIRGTFINMGPRKFFVLWEGMLAKHGTLKVVFQYVYEVCQATQWLCVLG